MENRINVGLPHERIAEFCQKWKIREFALFGSVLREDFRPDSDIDAVVTFAPKSAPTLPGKTSNGANCIITQS